MTATDETSSDPVAGDECTRAFRRGVNAAARVAAANGFDLREHLDYLTDATKAEIAEMLAARSSKGLWVGP